MSKPVKRLDRDKALLLVCDVQDNFAEQTYCYESLMVIVEAMIKSAKLLDIPILVTEHRKKKQSHIMPSLKALLNQCKYPSVVKEYVFDNKNRKFSMIVPKIQQVLEENPHRTQIILLGVEAHICVLQTCLDLIEKNYDVWVVADGVTSIGEFQRTIGLKRMEKAGGEITSFQTVLFQLLKYSYDEKFTELCDIMKEIQQKKTITHL